MNVEIYFKTVCKTFSQRILQNIRLKIYIICDMLSEKDVNIHTFLKRFIWCSAPCSCITNTCTCVNTRDAIATMRARESLFTLFHCANEKRKLTYRIGSLSPLVSMSIYSKINFFACLHRRDEKAQFLLHWNSHVDRLWNI